jgi:hypothetical protein
MLNPSPSPRSIGAKYNALTLRGSSVERLPLLSPLPPTLGRGQEMGVGPEYPLLWRVISGIIPHYLVLRLIGGAQRSPVHWRARPLDGRRSALGGGLVVPGHYSNRCGWRHTAVDGRAAGAGIGKAAGAKFYRQGDVCHSPAALRTKASGTPAGFNDLVGSTRFLLIAGGGNQLEVAFNEMFVERLGNRAALWIAPDAEHVQAFHLYPAEYEQRVIEFFDSVLSP